MSDKGRPVRPHRSGGGMVHKPIEVDSIEKLIEVAFPEDMNHNMQRDRPYSGQSHTDQGERGKQEISGITMRDLVDCYVRAVCLSTGETPYYHEADKGVDACLCRNDLFDVDWNDLDPIAISQNLTCEVERIMGIFPNLPKANK